jgi:NADPH:quinone reductase
LIRASQQIMKLIRFREPGPPSVLECIEVDVPEPQAGEVRIRAHAIGVGMPDVLIRAGTYSWMPPLPATPGTELSGIIEKVGPGVTSRRPGQRVYTTAREKPHRGGHYAQYVATPAEATFPLPDHVDLDAAATLANYQVAYHIFNDALRLRPGQSVLIYAAAGGMGNALIDLARSANLTIIGVVSSEEKARFARELGADHVINRAVEKVSEGVVEVTRGRGVDAIIDPIGGPSIPATLRCSPPAACFSFTARSEERPSLISSRHSGRAEIRRRCGNSPFIPGISWSRNAAPACGPSSLCSPPASFTRASMPASRSPRPSGPTRCSRAVLSWASCCCNHRPCSPSGELRGLVA